MKVGKNRFQQAFVMKINRKLIDDEAKPDVKGWQVHKQDGKQSELGPLLQSVSLVHTIWHLTNQG